MKRYCMFLMLILFAAVTLYSQSEYAGTPYFDKPYKMPGDYVMPWYFDRGDIGVACQYTVTADANFHEGTIASIVRDDEHAVPMIANTVSPTIRWRNTVNFEGDFWLRYTAIFQKGVYEMKFWAHQLNPWRDFTVKIMTMGLTTIDTIAPSRGMDNANATGEAGSVWNLTWFLDPDHTFEIAETDTYIVHIDLPLSSEPYLGPFTFKMVGAVDEDPPVLSGVPTEEVFGSFHATSSEAGKIYAVPTNVGVTIAELLAPNTGVVSTAMLEQEKYAVKDAVAAVPVQFSASDFTDNTTLLMLYAVDTTNNISHFSDNIRFYKREVGETYISRRVKSRTFPSIFQAWGEATNLPREDPMVTIARHDLVWNGAESFGLEWDTELVGGYRVLAEGFTESSIVDALNFRRQLLELNPNIILIVNLNYRGAKASWLPDDHAWWLRDADGNKIVSWTGGQEPWYRLDFANPDLTVQVGKWARSAVNSGVFDGVLLDWWDENQQTNARLALIQEVRRAISDTCLIIVNANDRYSVQSAPYINGVFMETGSNIPKTPARWKEIQDALAWNQANVLEPKLVCLEVWYDKSRDELNRMRAATTMSLTLSDGYCLFSEPNSVPGLDHRHDWYSFWNKSLGKAVGKGSLQGNGTYMREFENGYAVYNPMGNGQVTVEFSDNYISVATGVSAKAHNVADQDGDIFLHDVNAVFSPQHIPIDFSLSQNYPNPFNSVTNIRFSIPDAGNVKLSVYNMLGEKVKTLMDVYRTAGLYNVEWDGTNSAGQDMVSGVYFYKLQMGSNVQVKKMLFMK